MGVSTLLALSLVGSAEAHRLDEYLQATLIGVTRDGIDVEIHLTPGVSMLPVLMAVERNVVVLDVRPAVEYEAGHIHGARSIPITELRTRLKDLPKNREIVAYCRGPYCVFADEAVAVLRNKGYKAFRLEGGFPDWAIQGLPTSLSARP
jgi:rhodanese-related sulfurtransferase